MTHASATGDVYTSAGNTIQVVNFDPSLPATDLRALADQAEREYARLRTLLGKDVGRITVRVRDSGIGRHFPPATIRIPSRLVRTGTAITAHEIAHLLAQGWHSQVLKEGLAVYLQEQVGEQSGWPNYRDGSARYFLGKGDNTVRSLDAAEAVLQKGRSAGTDARRAAYSMAGSFVKWLVDVKLAGDLERFMSAICVSGDLRGATGDEAAALERAWRHALDDQ